MFHYCCPDTTLTERNLWITKFYRDFHTIYLGMEGGYKSQVVQLPDHSPSFEGTYSKEQFFTAGFCTFSPFPTISFPYLPKSEYHSSQDKIIKDKQYHLVSFSSCCHHIPVTVQGRFGVIFFLYGYWELGAHDNLSNDTCSLCSDISLFPLWVIFSKRVNFLCITTFFFNVKNQLSQKTKQNKK